MIPSAPWTITVVQGDDARMNPDCRRERCYGGADAGLREAARPILAEFQVLIRLLEQAVETFEAIADKIDAVFGFNNRADARHNRQPGDDENREVPPAVKNSGLTDAFA